MMDEKVEEHVILRVPPELVDRVQQVVKPKEEGKGEEIKVFRLEPKNSRDWVFQIGKDKYFATLRDLPTMVETMKTKKSKDQESGVFYKSGDVGQVLEVSNVMVNKEDGTAQSKPTLSHQMDDGLTAPMTRARSERFKRLDRSIRHGIAGEPGKENETKTQVMKMDRELRNIVNILQDNKGEYEFVHEEIVEMEPYMSYWDQSKVIIKEGDDQFLTEARKAYDLAYENYRKKHKLLDKSSSNSNLAKGVIKASGTLSMLTSKANTAAASSRSQIQMMDSMPADNLKKSKQDKPSGIKTLSPKQTASATPPSILGSAQKSTKSTSPIPTVAPLAPPPPKETAMPIPNSFGTFPTPPSSSPSLGTPSVPQQSPSLPTPSPSPNTFPQPSPSPNTFPNPSPSPPATLLSGDSATPGTMGTPAGGTLTPGATPGAATPGALGATATPGLSQPSPSPSPGVYTEEETAEITQLKKQLQQEAAKYELAKKSLQDTRQKIKNNKNLGLKKKYEQKEKACEAEVKTIMEEYTRIKKEIEDKRAGKS